MSQPVTETTAKPAAACEEPIRILITALGGEGGGVLMGWLVDAARANGFAVQATSVPGVAQRTGSTSYYLEIAARDAPTVFNLVPMPGRVEIVLSSELVEAARVIEAGYVSPDRTMLIASASRVYATAEKIQLADGRYDAAAVGKAATQMAQTCHLADLQQLAQDNGTFISATLFGAVAACGALPWDIAQSRQVLGSESSAQASLRGFDAAAAAIKGAPPAGGRDSEAKPEHSHSGDLDSLMEIAVQRLVEYQDADYGDLYRARMQSLIDKASEPNESQRAVLEEAARRLANWMAYEDVARVAELKTGRERFAQVRSDCQATNDQIVRLTEFLKPRAEEIADMLPVAVGQRMMRRARAGKRFPLLGQGRRIASNAAWGYWLLRAIAAMKRYRRASLRYDFEQREIDEWLTDLAAVLPRSAEFAQSLAQLPRVRKGYSDTLQRGLAAYRTINQSIVKPAIAGGNEASMASALSDALGAAFHDENHQSLKETVIRFQPRSEAASVH